MSLIVFGFCVKKARISSVKSPLKCTVFKIGQRHNMSFSVLICDDSSLGRRSVKRCLPDDFAREVHMAGNGAEAMEIMRQTEVNLLFLDLTMPVMDGVEVLEAIRAERIEVFVVVISGDIQPKMKERVLGLGALDFINKPVDWGRLEATLKQFGLY